MSNTQAIHGMNYNYQQQNKDADLEKLTPNVNLEAIQKKVWKAGEVLITAIFQAIMYLLARIFGNRKEKNSLEPNVGDTTAPSDTKQNLTDNNINTKDNTLAVKPEGEMPTINAPQALGNNAIPSLDPNVFDASIGHDGTLRLNEGMASQSLTPEMMQIITNTAKKLVENNAYANPEQIQDYLNKVLVQMNSSDFTDEAISRINTTLKDDPSAKKDVGFMTGIINLAFVEKALRKNNAQQNQESLYHRIMKTITQADDSLSNDEVNMYAKAAISRAPQSISSSATAIPENIATALNEYFTQNPEDAVLCAVTNSCKAGVEHQMKEQNYLTKEELYKEEEPLKSTVDMPGNDKFKHSDENVVDLDYTENQSSTRPKM